MKITAIGTFTEEQVEDFATNELKYKDTIKTGVDNIFTGEQVEEIPNPVSKEEAITEAFKQHVYSFFNSYTARKEKEAVAQIEATLEATKQVAREQIEALKEQSIEIIVE